MAKVFAVQYYGCEYERDVSDLELFDSEEKAKARFNELKKKFKSKWEINKEDFDCVTKRYRNGKLWDVWCFEDNYYLTMWMWSRDIDVKDKAYVVEWGGNFLDENFEQADIFCSRKDALKFYNSKVAHYRKEWDKTGLKYILESDDHSTRICNDNYFVDIYFSKYIIK